MNVERWNGRRKKESIGGDWEVEEETGKCRRRLEGRGGGWKVQEEIGR
jgi:hypothetical protein